MESIRKVSTIFTIDDSDHNKKLKNINAQYKLTQSEVKLAGERLKQFGDNVEDLKFKQQALSKQTQTLTDKMNLYRESMEKASKKAEENSKKLQEIKKNKEMLEAKYKSAIKNYGEENELVFKLREQLDRLNQEYKEQKDVVDKNIKSVNNYNTKLNDTEAQLTKVQGELDRTNKSLDDQGSKWGNVGTNLTNAGNKIQNFGSKLSSVGSTLTKAITVPVIGIGAMAVKTQIEFESAFAGVRKTVDATEEEFKKLEQGIKDMSKTMPSSAEEIAKVAESAGQLGIETDSILKFTKTIMDLGNATNLVGEEGASQLAKFANIVGMSQDNFDRLGSSIVALGNSSATTEQDIVNMAMRIAGAGKQVGMTESEILALSASLSSVGIEAEAGGSAMSTLLSKIQLAVETGSDDLAGFASVANMTSQQFADAFRDNAVGALTEFIEGLAKAEQNGTSAIAVLDDMGISELTLRDALLRASSANDLFSRSIEVSNRAWEENVALQNEASQRYSTTESQIVILKNEITDLARDIGVELLPIIKDGLVVVKDLIQKFKELPPQTKENIVKFAGLSAVIAPVIGTVGKLVEGFGGVVKMAGTLGKSLGVVKTATSTLGTASALAGGTSGLAGLATSLGTVASVATPYVLAGGAIAGVGYAVYKGVKEQAIPSVKLFADEVEGASVTVDESGKVIADTSNMIHTKISEATQKAVGSYIALDDGVKMELTELYITSTTITDQIKNDMVGKIDEMSTMVIDGYEKQKTESIAQLQELFGTQSLLTETEQADILAKTTTFYENKKVQTQDYEAQINAIMNTASQEKRALTQDEVTQITTLKQQMRDNAIRALSETEKEASIILQRMKEYDGQITKEQATQHIQTLNEARDKEIEIAQQKYDEQIALITELRDVSGVITKEQADTMIAEEQRQRDGIVTNAQKTRDEAVDKIFRMNEELAKDVDFTTGKVVGWFGRIFSTWDKWTPTRKSLSVDFIGSAIDKIVDIPQVGENALGTTHFKGGLTTINERGYEVVDLPKGTKIKNHTQSENMIKDVAFKTASALLNGMNIGGTSNDIAVQVYIGNEQLDKFVTDKVIRNMGRTTNNLKRNKGGW